MFRWFRESGGELGDVATAFTGMLHDGRRVFDLAMVARLGERSAAEVADELRQTEERTDEAERHIRRLLLVHASMHGGVDIPACLLYMSVAKDAERVADLSKNLFGIAQTVAGPPDGPLVEDFRRLRDELSPMVTDAARIFSDEDTAAAEAFIQRGRELQRHCGREIDELLLERRDVPQPAASVLTYRHLARVAANLLNIVSAVVMPLDQLDYPTTRPGDG